MPAIKNLPPRMKNREISWLSFSHRILQEAENPEVPLYERIKFLAIFSSNMHEFFRVRVASIRAMVKMKKGSKKYLEFDPQSLLRRVLKIVEEQQRRYGEIFRNQIKRELNRASILLIRETDLSGAHKDFVRTYFKESVQPQLEPYFLGKDKEPPFLKDQAIYLVARLARKGETAQSDIPSPQGDPFQHALIEIPAPPLQRFVVLPKKGNRHHVIFLDDIIRFNLDVLFPYHRIVSAYSVKLTRDAGLYIDDEETGDLVGKIRTALTKRPAGVPSRFLFDNEMPPDLKSFMRDSLQLQKEDMVEGGRYHNFHDFFAFPNPLAPRFTYEPPEHLQVHDLANAPSILDAVRQKDYLLAYPYHSFEPVVRFLEESSNDPSVTSIRITLYRTASDSRVIQALIRAAQQGKAVTAFFEVKARFDEASNIRRAEELERAGAHVLYSFPGVKVHAKLCLVTRKTNDGQEFVGYLSTGNFNEKTARLYSDHGFFTADPRLLKDVERVFEILERRTRKQTFDHLLVAPYQMRETFYRLIDNEVSRAKNGEPAGIIAKMNSLEDPEMIAKLYEASEAGVPIQLIVRGICCLIPGVSGMSKRISVRSIVDRFLEHSRIFVFHNSGTELYFLSSADWMTRNLSRRIEVAFPIYDPSIQKQVRAMLDVQMRDNVKARVIDRRQTNRMVDKSGKETVRSQSAMYDYVRQISGPQQPDQPDLVAESKREVKASELV